MNRKRVLFFFCRSESYYHENACLSPNSTAAPAATVVMAMAFCQKDGGSLLAPPALSGWGLFLFRRRLLNSASTTSRNPSCKGGREGTSQWLLYCLTHQFSPRKFIK